MYDRVFSGKVLSYPYAQGITTLWHNAGTFPGTPYVNTVYSDNSQQAYVNI
jgi:hypothetical protein